MATPDISGKSAHHRLSTPLREDEVRNLNVGDLVLLNGTVFTARDAAHKRLADGESPPVCLSRAVIYHCGPVVVGTEGGHTAGETWKVTAAGPTTSIREEPYMPYLLEKFRFRMIIGKGGMGRQTLQACRLFGCVYLHAVGGTARVLAKTVGQVENVFWTEAGLPEAIWQLSVHEFPAIVTMDSHGRSLHQQVRKRSRARLRKFLSAVYSS